MSGPFAPYASRPGRTPEAKEKRMSDKRVDPNEMEFWEEALPHCGEPGLPRPFDVADAPLHDLFAFSTGALPPLAFAAR